MKFYFRMYSILILCLLISGDAADDYQYTIGAGIADITGPAAEVATMGYVTTVISGIHLRLFSRAVIVVDRYGNRICYITADLLGITSIVKIEVIKRLQQKYQDLYRHENVLISATHAHSGPGGFSQYFIYIVSNLGFSFDNFYAIVVGIVKSIERAHNSLRPGYIYYNEGQIMDVNINRSPASYLNNPKEERDRYKYNVDKLMSLLKFVDTNGNPLALINWHAVHCVSMNNTNQLMSSDNKGYASLLFERDYNRGQLPGRGRFVAIFSNMNEGDSTPNTAGPRCIKSGKPCDFVTSSCPDKTDYCVGVGPGRDMFESTQIIARKQYLKAKELFNRAEHRIQGRIEFIYQNINMSDFEVKLSQNKTARTCKPALGYAFAAGTTDGPDLLFPTQQFHQGTRKGEESLFWNSIRDIVLGKPSKEMTDCQYPKAIGFPIGEINIPYQWAPVVISTQLFKMESLVIAGLPAEFTTMSGRRVREAIKRVFAYNGLPVNVFLSGLANIYTSYVTTYEEYQIQRYEGGSTLYGPHTLQAYIQQFVYLAHNMVKKTPIPPGPPLPNLLNKQITLKPGVILDTPKPGHNFGDVLSEAQPTYPKGSSVKVTFVGGHPQNNLRLESTFLTVDRQKENSTLWKVIATDSCWETKFMWRRTNAILGESEVDIIWDVPHNTPNGKYRIRYFGDHKNALGKITGFIGTSSAFEVR